MDRTANPRGVLPIMAYSGEAPTERGAFVRLQVFEKVRDFTSLRSKRFLARFV